MKIGIIGSGQIGGTLTRRLSALGHKVFVANSRGPESLRDLAAETGAKPVSVREAARSGELVGRRGPWGLNPRAHRRRTFRRGCGVCRPTTITDLLKNL